MTELMRRRRALMAAKNISLPPISLYDNGVISEFAGGLNNIGYSRNSKFNTATQEGTYLKYTCTSTSAAPTVLGGKAFTFTNVLPQSCIGRTLHVKYKHKNTSTTANDRIRAVVAPIVTSSTIFNTAYPDSIYATAELTQDADFVAGELVLPITIIGYVSICGYKESGGGIYDIRVTEVWIE